MSSITVAGSAEEHSVEEFVGTRLSLGRFGGGGEGSRRPRTVQLFGEVLALQDDDGDGRGAGESATASAAGMKKRDASTAAVAGSRQNKKVMTFHGGDRRSPTSGGRGGGRKKLRLSGAQAVMLEDSFRAHNILTHAEKQELARRVGLSARQVEVWFQNRRARTKLKQTEVDCELLRRWCDGLAGENARLRRDLAVLRASAVCAACRDKLAGRHRVRRRDAWPDAVTCAGSRPAGRPDDLA